MYYFISYNIRRRWTSTVSESTFHSGVIDKHPFEWQDSINRFAIEGLVTYSLLSWQSISLEEYQMGRKLK